LALVVEGKRTGEFPLGTGRLLAVAGRKSWISVEDFVISLADEIGRRINLRGRLATGD